MTERNELLASIVATTADYREGDLAAPTPAHVERWVNQFDSAVQLPILREMDHVLKRTYYSRKRTKELLARLFEKKELVGDDPCTGWKGLKFLNIQGGGASQREMRALFSGVLDKKCGFSVDDCGADPRAFVYLDDAIFSGGRIRQDLTEWIAQDAPDNFTLHVIVMAWHESSYYNFDRIKKAEEESGKSMKLVPWPDICPEDRKKYTDTSDVLRPVSIPDDPATQAYTNDREYQPRLRTPGQVGTLGFFSSDAGRQVLEQEFLKAGVRIREGNRNLGEFQRPLGNMMLDTIGFGSLIVTFRNCPNNTPLALWAGNPWYPLFPRTSNSATAT